MQTGVGGLVGRSVPSEEVAVGCRGPRTCAYEIRGAKPKHCADRLLPARKRANAPATTQRQIVGAKPRTGQVYPCRNGKACEFLARTKPKSASASWGRESLAEQSHLLRRWQRSATSLSNRFVPVLRFQNSLTWLQFCYDFVRGA